MVTIGIPNLHLIIPCIPENATPHMSLLKEHERSANRQPQMSWSPVVRLMTIHFLKYISGPQTVRILKTVQYYVFAMMVALFVLRILKCVTPTWLSSNMIINLKRGTCLEGHWSQTPGFVTPFRHRSHPAASRRDGKAGVWSRGRWPEGRMVQRSSRLATHRIFYGSLNTTSMWTSKV